MSGFSGQNNCDSLFIIMQNAVMQLTSHICEGAPDLGEIKQSSDR
jgi:hypothetical protein